MDLEQRITRLESVTFPNGALASEDGRMSIVPIPAPTKEGETAEFQILGLAEGEQVTIYSDRMDIALPEQFPGGFWIHAKSSGGYAARSMINIQRGPSAAAQIVFPFDVVR